MTLIDHLETLLMEAFQPTHLTLEDESDKHRSHRGYREGKKHLALTIQSERLPSSLIQAHRMIHKVVAEHWHEIHALRITIMPTGSSS